MPTNDLGTLYDRPLRFIPDRIPELFINPPQGYKPFGYLQPDDVVYTAPAPEPPTTDIGDLFGPANVTRPNDLGTLFPPGRPRRDLGNDTLFTAPVTTHPADIANLYPSVSSSHPADLGDIIPDGDPRQNLPDSNVYK